MADGPPKLKRSEPAEREHPAVVAGPQQRPARPSRWRRPLLILGPLVAIVASFAFYFSGGRFVSEENSFIGQSTIAIAPQVTGQVSSVLVLQNQEVEANQPLFVIDPEPFRIARDGAQAGLTMVHDQIQAGIETYNARKQQADQAQASLTYAEQQLDRAQSLLNRGAGTQAALDSARRDRDVAAATLASAQADANSALAQIGGNGDTKLEDRAQYQQALAKLQDAERNLRLTTVTAPFSGVVTNVNAIELGAFLTAGQQAISLVDTQHSWADTNLRETDLTNVRPGNPATIVVDTYPGHTFQGRVQTINPATGAVFSLIPPQNATGNWVKVVQRIPVRIAIEPDPQAPMLRNGMSATVTIDTGNRRSFATLWRDLRSLFR